MRKKSGQTLFQSLSKSDYKFWICRIFKVGVTILKPYTLKCENVKFIWRPHET